jgi:hypothetical protein
MILEKLGIGETLRIWDPSFFEKVPVILTYPYSKIDCAQRAPCSQCSRKFASNIAMLVIETSSIIDTCTQDWFSSRASPATHIVRCEHHCEHPPRTILCVAWSRTWFATIASIAAMHARLFADLFLRPWPAIIASLVRDHDREHDARGGMTVWSGTYERTRVKLCHSKIETPAVKTRPNPVSIENNDTLWPRYFRITHSTPMNSWRGRNNLGEYHKLN